jgi:hypothetical protein
MNAERPDSNAELVSGDPLRVAFALVALLLGCLAAFH